MQHIMKSNQKTPKGVRLKWDSLRDLKTVTVEKMNIKGSKVFSGASSGKMTTCNTESNNFLIP